MHGYCARDGELVHATKNSRSSGLPGTLSQMEKITPALRTGVTAMSLAAIALLP